MFASCLLGFLLVSLIVYFGHKMPSWRVVSYIYQCIHITKVNTYPSSKFSSITFYLLKLTSLFNENTWLLLLHMVHDLYSCTCEIICLKFIKKEEKSWFKTFFLCLSTGTSSSLIKNHKPNILSSKVKLLILLTACTIFKSLPPKMNCTWNS